MNETTEIKNFAIEIVSQMSTEDRARFNRDEWFEGVGNLQAGGMDHVSTDAILDAIEDQIGERWQLDTGTDGEDDVLLGTREDVEADILHHHDLDEMPSNWTLARL